MTSQAPLQIKSVVGRNIALAREEQTPQRWTQRDLAVRLNIDSRAVSRWESGRVMPRPEMLTQLGVELGRDPGWFFTDHGPVAEQSAA